MSDGTQGGSLPGLLFRDIRSSAVRNTIEAGIRSINPRRLRPPDDIDLQRYVIVGEGEVKTTEEKLELLLEKSRAVEPRAGIEPATSSLQNWRSTN
jgi:hypothetical protein